jgi:hypothetical protein
MDEIIIQQSLKEIASTYSHAENVTSQAERTCEKLPIPSINQLRYAGKHLCQALQLDNYDDAIEQLNRSKTHCQRAIFDAYDTSIAYIGEDLEIFHNKYKEYPSSLFMIVPDYSQKLEIIESARELIREATKNRDNRQEFHAECEPHYENLSKIRKSLKILEPMLEKHIDDDAKAAKKDDKRYVTTTMLTAAALLLTALAIPKIPDWIIAYNETRVASTPARIEPSPGQLKKITPSKPSPRGLFYA